jgi:hypothetical protein
MNKLLFLGALFMIAVCCRCTTPVAGGSSQQGNGIVVGSVVAAGGAPAKESRIRIRPMEYLRKPGAINEENGIYDAVTDASGSFFVSGVNPGSYLIEANDGVLSAALIRLTVVAFKDTASAGTMDLKPYARISGVTTISGGQLYVQVKGLERLVKVEHGGAFSIADLPAGTFELVFTDSAAPRAPLSDLSIATRPGSAETVAVPAGWRHACRLRFNTAASGADVTGTATDFPVLVRLNVNNFDFTAARSDGADLRFTGKDSAVVIPFEIERWDSVKKQAEIWVKVDTLYGSDSVQGVMMHWGNPDAGARSGGAEVFDTAAGFQGVWHMSQPGNTMAYDATANRYNGTPSGMNASSLTEGMVGGAQRFDGASGYITLSGTASSRISFPYGSTYTLSAWVYTEVVDSQAHYIISKGNKNYNLNLSSYNFWELYDIQNGVGCESNFTPPHLRQWKYLTGVRNGTDQRLYVDGICMDSTIMITTGVTVRDSTITVQIGKRAESAYGFWNGMIDEVIISNTSRNADWIRLCYMNQKEDDRLVQFR